MDVSHDMLGGLFLFYYHPAKCGPSVLWQWKWNVFDLSRDHSVKVSRDFVGGFFILSD